MYYKDVVEVEREVHEKCTRGGERPAYETLLLKHWQFEETRKHAMYSLPSTISSSSSSSSSKLLGNSIGSSSSAPIDSEAAAPSGFMNSAMASQVMLLPEEAQLPSELFPTGIKDINSQQVDLRRHNSWLLTLEDVSTPELAEVMAINAMAPCILAAKLKPLLLAKRPESGSSNKLCNLSSLAR